MAAPTLRCRYCRRTADWLLSMALLQALGCSTSDGPADQCWAREDGGEHDFTQPEPEEA